MPGHKTFASEILASSDVNDYLMKQSIMVFASTSARDSALSGVVREGMLCYTEDENFTYIYNGSTWVPFSSPWKSTTPTWNSGVTTGDGTFAASYRYDNGSLWFRGQFTLGGSSAVSGVPQLTLPLSFQPQTWPSVGAGWLRDTSTGNKYSCVVRVGIGQSFIAFDRDTTEISSTSPFTWASGDVIQWQVLVAND